MDEVINKTEVHCQVCDFKRTFTSPLVGDDWFEVKHHAYPSYHVLTIRQVRTMTWTYKPKAKEVEESKIS